MGKGKVEGRGIPALLFPTLSPDQQCLFCLLCRDCVNTSSMDALNSAHQPTLTTKVQGLLRTKMEGG